MAYCHSFLKVGCRVFGWVNRKETDALKSSPKTTLLVGHTQSKTRPQRGRERERWKNISGIKPELHQKINLRHVSLCGTRSLWVIELLAFSVPLFPPKSSIFLTLCKIWTFRFVLLYKEGVMEIIFTTVRGTKKASLAPF